MAVPIIPILTGAGALLGGIKGYQEGGLGGVVPGALTGGAVTGLGAGATRMAGSKLLGSTALGKAALTKAARGIPLSDADKALLAAPAAAAIGVGGTSALTGGFGTAGPSSRLAGDLVSAGSQAIGLGRAATYSINPATGEVTYSEPAVPSGLPSPAGLLTQQDPLGSYQANLLYRQQLGDVEMDQVKKQTAYMAPVIDEMKRREMQRQLAAAKVRQELATGAQLTAQGQRGAQALASQGMGAIGQGLVSQYQYG